MLVALTQRRSNGKIHAGKSEGYVDATLCGKSYDDIRDKPWEDIPPQERCPKCTTIAKEGSNGVD